MFNNTLARIRKTDEIKENGDTERALKLLKDLLEELQKGSIISKYDIPLVLKKIGICYTEMNLLDEAKKAYKKALRIAQQDYNLMEEADIYSFMTFLELKRGDIQLAEQYLKKALSFTETKRGERYKEIKANGFAAKGEYLYAKRTYRKALKAYEKAGRIDKLGRYKERIKELETKLGI